MSATCPIRVPSSIMYSTLTIYHRKPVRYVGLSIWILYCIASLWQAKLPITGLQSTIISCSKTLSLTYRKFLTCMSGRIRISKATK
ncbi:hypothetical protein PNOK_0290200 [Pyrrhoderma noxium]|uniref:Uncharacterized protein n=1 Tax=Pyrrhoderma noxium TaxID=2282107 RepID=A0A286ULE3_9AGAM|nr:hypothetical protein PNOK_0290200 [Pyrrhoderma noxium]